MPPRSSTGESPCLILSERPEFHCSCDLHATLTVPANSLANLPFGTGEVYQLIGNYSISSEHPANWILTLPNGTTSSGTSSHIDATWDGTLPDGTLAPIGTYQATLNVTSNNNPACTSTATLPITIEPTIAANSCSLSVHFGSSANVANGNLSHSQELFSTHGGALPVGMNLYYNSRDSHNASMGRGWSYDYEVTLKENSSGSVLISESNWKYRHFTLANGTYSASSGDQSTLTKQTDGSFTLTEKGGTVSTFSNTGKLLSISDHNGNTTVLGYANGNLTSITDPSGRNATLSYDANNRLVSLVDPAGNNYTFTYIGNTLASVTYPDGGQWQYSYDANAFMLSKRDQMGNSTFYAYDASHRVVSSTDPEGKTRRMDYPQTGDSVKSTTFIEKDGGDWRYSYDTRKGHLLAKTDPQEGTISYTYDNNGHRTSTTSPDGTTTTYTYDTAGNMLTSTDAMGMTTSYSYNSLGQVLSIIDPQGGSTTYTYDAKGNLTSLTDPAKATTRYEYDGKGNIVKVIDPGEQTTTLTYDSKGNIGGVTDASGVTTSYNYDAAGNMISITDPNGAITQFSYDSRNRLVKAIDPSGNIRTYTYSLSGNKTSETDANGNITRYEYNSRNQLIKTIDAMGNATTYAYGSSTCPSCGGGNGEKLTALTDSNGNSTMYLYDQLGKLVKETDPQGSSTTYTYDTRGNLTTKSDANGNTINFSYDAGGRLLKKTYPDNSEETYTYDQKGNILTAGNSNISYTFSYDAAGRMLTSTDYSGRVIQYSYDLSGNKTRMITPDGKAIAYSYDKNNRLTAIINGGTFTLNYDSKGQRTRLTYPNGDTATYIYDNQGRLDTLTRKNAGGAIISSNSYTLDKIGNRQTNSTQERTSSYSYDPVYRLVQALTNTPGNSNNSKTTKGTINAVQQQKEIFTYDPAGNRLTSANNRSYSYSAGNQLITDNGTTYSYDKNGNLTQKSSATETTTYSWDYENRLVKVTAPTATAEYAYDPFGRRIQKKVTEDTTATTTNYFYDGQAILFDFDETGIVGNRYIHGPNIDEPLSVATGKEKYYYHADGLGSIIALTDQTGKTVQTYEYDSFGNLKDQKNQVKQPFTYTGREWDKETGTYHYRKRTYDPMDGRFLSKDPIGFKGGINLYSYVSNNPVNWIDPRGLSKVHGQWCGGDWTGGEKEQYSPDHDIPGYYSDPEDQLDDACKVHDKCYYKCREAFPCDKKSRGQCFLVCDGALDDAALTAGGFDGNLVSAAMRRPGNRIEPNPCSCGGILGE